MAQGEGLFGIHGTALALRSQRLSLLASNIANAATPGYRARDIDFDRRWSSPSAATAPTRRPSDAVAYRVPIDAFARRQHRRALHRADALRRECGPVPHHPLLPRRPHLDDPPRAEGRMSDGTADVRLRHRRPRHVGAARAAQHHRVEPRQCRRASPAAATAPSARCGRSSSAVEGRPGHRHRRGRSGRPGAASSRPGATIPIIRSPTPKATSGKPASTAPPSSIDMVETARQYQNNVQVLQTAKTLTLDTLRLGQ